MKDKKFEIPSLKEKVTLPTMDIKKIVEKGSSVISNGVAVAKNGAVAAKQGVAKMAETIGEKSKEIQMNVLAYVDKKKNARFLSAKLLAFEDGMKAAKVEAVDYIKKYVNFCLASAAISYYFARCDGSIDEMEYLELEYDLDSIIKNKDLPEALRNKLTEISKKEDWTFDDLRYYLDGVGIETLKEFARDIDEIIFANDEITPEELRAKKEFENYYIKRLEAEEHE